MRKLKPPKVEEVSEEEERSEVISSGRPTWSGSTSMGLVNIPIRAIPIIIEIKVSFPMLHQKCKTPTYYRLFCDEGDEVPKSETATVTSYGTSI